MNPYLSIERIEFVVTYRCTGRCLHCSMGEAINTPSPFKHVLAQPAAQAISSLAQMYPIESVMTFGGEPLLYPDVVCAIHDAAASCQIPMRQLITNGCFSADPNAQVRIAKALTQAGVNQLLLSVDAFHQQTLPIENVYAFAQAYKRLGQQIALQPAWVVNNAHDNPYNAQTKQILAAFAALEIPISSGNDIFLAGSAAKHLAQYYPTAQLDPCAICGRAPYTQPLTGITSLSIVPSGDVMVCGFAIGNIYEEDIAAVIARYDPYSDARMRTLATGNAASLMQYAREQGIQIDPTRMRSICDICQHIVKVRAN